MGAVRGELERAERLEVLDDDLLDALSTLVEHRDQTILHDPRKLVPRHKHDFLLVDVNGCRSKSPLELEEHTKKLWL